MDDNQPVDICNIDLFSVIILHYNQQCFIKDAIDSVFSQNYGNIELIIADDASYEFDTDSIMSYIENNRTKQITNVKYLFNKENIGTVKNINGALRESTGRFAIFFAADDAFYDPEVLNNFAKMLTVLPSDQYMVCAQCSMMDENMSEKLGNFVNTPLAYIMNSETPIEQYRRIAFSCFYAMGATAFKLNMLKDKGYFDEAYRIIEDWSYYLELTLDGSKILYSDFQALRHRHGGVSHFNQEIIPPHVIEYRNDVLLIQERLILPHILEFPFRDRVKLIQRYERERKTFGGLLSGNLRPRRIDIIRKNKKIYSYIIASKAIINIPKLNRKSIKYLIQLLPVCAILYIIDTLKLILYSDQTSALVNIQTYEAIKSIILVMFILVFVSSVCLTACSLILFIRKEWRKFFSKNK